MADTTGDYSLRAEEYETMLKGFALQEFKMKQVVMVSSSSAWIESYYRESATELSGGTAESVKGIPRLTEFPTARVEWTKVSAYIEKYGMECIVAWEDDMQDRIDVIARSLLRAARAVAYAVDTQIYSVLAAAAGNTVTIAAGYEWNSPTQAQREPIDNLLNAKQLMEEDNFDPNKNGAVLLNPKDYRSLLGNSKIINNPSYKAADVVANGVVGQIVNLSIIVSNVVTADEALVVIKQECGTWKSAAGLTSFTEIDKGIKYKIRAFEMGVCQATTPNAIVKISNTAA